MGFFGSSVEVRTLGGGPVPVIFISLVISLYLPSPVALLATLFNPLLLLMMLPCLLDVQTSRFACCPALVLRT